MIISNELSKPIYLESIDVPTYTEYFWTLNLEEMDFMLQPITMFEELTTPIIVLDIFGYLIIAPANWNILVYSRETSQLDVAEVSDLTRGGFHVLVYEHAKDKIIPARVKVIDYKPEDLVRTPLLLKNMMLCHHLGPKYWACLSPSDIYNKFLKNKVIGDLMY